CHASKRATGRTCPIGTGETASRSSSSTAASWAPTCGSTRWCRWRNVASAASPTTGGAAAA
ncbi:MAG: hypothetical protein AVDCRST_MAG59-5297, partial [uncultured Thermomicrobiales bacterium]